MTTTIATATAQPATATTPAARPAKSESRQPKALPAPNSDFYEVYETLSAEELATVKRVRAFMETKVAPVITKYWVDDAFPFELLPAMKELGIGGLAMHGYGCAGGSVGLFGFVQMEMARVDPSFSTFFGVHSGSDGLDLSRWIGGAETEMAASNGALGKDQLLRPLPSPWSGRERAEG
jgi:alkylation response protein AidB-like acyl-CoA dehydrogenase